MVGLTRFELVTPRLSSVCSNQLSYRPKPALHCEVGIRHTTPRKLIKEPPRAIYGDRSDSLKTR